MKEIEEEQKYGILQSNKKAFIEKLSVKNTGRTKLLKLQQEFSNGNISEEEMTEEDIDSLHQLYDEQILELEKSTENYKRKILEIRKKLKK